MKKLLVMLVVTGLLSGLVAFAEGDAAKETAPEKVKAKEAVQLEAVEVQGILKAEEKETKRGKMTFYSLQIDEKVLPLPFMNKKLAPEKLVGKTVKIKGQGLTKDKKGNDKVQVRKIEAIEEVSDAPKAE